MNNKITQKELDEYLAKAPAFIISSKKTISNTILESEQNIIGLSNSVLSDDFGEAKNLLIAILNFIQTCKSGVIGNTTDTTGKRLTLIVNYFQSIHHTEDLLLRGQYIAVAALMKKDFETMVKLMELKAGKAKYGKSPNQQNAPQELRFIYGELNDIAHVSKDHVIGFYLEKESELPGKGVSSTPQFKEEQFKAFYSYHLCIMQTIVFEAIELYKEMYGIDSNFKDVMGYFYIVSDILKQFHDKFMAQSEHLDEDNEVK